MTLAQPLGLRTSLVTSLEAEVAAPSEASSVALEVVECVGGEEGQDEERTLCIGSSSLIMCFVSFLHFHFFFIFFSTLNRSKSYRSSFINLSLG